MTKEQLERFALFHQQIALLLFGSQKNKRFARKTDEQIPNPAQQTSLIPCFDVTKALAQQISLLPQFDVTQELAQHTYFIPLVKVTQDWPNSRVGNLLFADSLFALLLKIAQFKEQL